MRASEYFARGNRRTIPRLLTLRQEAQSEKQPRVALRLQAILLSVQKHGGGQISNLLHVHRSSVYNWIDAWNEHGMEGLLEGHRSGRRARLQDDQQEQLKDILESGPVAHGLNTGVWTSPLIAQVIEEEFDVHYHPGHVRKLLHQLGFSVQRPTVKLVAADPCKKNRWIRYTYPNLKKKRAKKTL